MEDKTMALDGKRTLVPKRRFPEFRDAKEWTKKPMGEVYSYKGNNSLSRDKLNYASGSIKNIHYGDIHTKFSTLFDITKETVPYVNASESQKPFKAENYCIEGDMVFADASEDLDDIGKSIEIVNLNGQRVVSGLHTILARQTVARLVVGFAGYLFKSPTIRKQIRKESQGAKVLGLSGGRLAQITIPFPSDKAEQRKIADCLASIDDLITLEVRKLDSLKKHEKGLMQQLFPAVGQTLPELRFPEFRGESEWDEKKFGQLCHFVRGPFGGALKKDIFVKDGYAVYEQSHAIYSDFNSFRYFIAEEKYKELKRFSVRPGDIIMSCSGTMGKFSVIPERAKDGVINQALLKLTVNKEYHLGFVKLTLELPLNQEKLLSQSAGGAIKNVVGVSEMKEIELCLPSYEEQQKIAMCLSNLDGLITAQTQKLAALRSLKKGLMQQLFPVLSEMGV